MPDAGTVGGSKGDAVRCLLSTSILFELTDAPTDIKVRMACSKGTRIGCAAAALIVVLVWALHAWSLQPDRGAIRQETATLQFDFDAPSKGTLTPALLSAELEADGSKDKPASPLEDELVGESLEETELIDAAPTATVDTMTNHTGEGDGKVVYLGASDNLQDRPLIMYAYFETESARQNLKFFLSHGLHANADFVFILNGETDVDNTLIPASESNVLIVRRPNTCYDLGAHGQVLRDNDGELMRKHSRFILMNASIRGPFVPFWSRECWSDAYLGRLSDQVKVRKTTVTTSIPDDVERAPLNHLCSSSA